jgi:hypothetical protein
VWARGISTRVDSTYTMTRKMEMVVTKARRSVVKYWI